MIEGSFVNFTYRELSSGENSRLVERKYSGLVSKVYRNGQFILTEPNGTDPQRFENLSVV